MMQSDWLHNIIKTNSIYIYIYLWSLCIYFISSILQICSYASGARQSAWACVLLSDIWEGKPDSWPASRLTIFQPHFPSSTQQWSLRLITSRLTLLSDINLWTQQVPDTLSSPGCAENAHKHMHVFGNKLERTYAVLSLYKLEDS